jgi:glycosyltransferase involved in cell wall biosynthesis
VIKLRKTHTPKIALLWTHFLPYHMDRCEAVTERLRGHADVVAVEVAATKPTATFNPSLAGAGATKVTIFPGREYDSIAFFPRFLGMLNVLRRCDWLFVGIGYGDPAVIALSFCLRILGKNVILMTDSKFDDHQRSALKEFGKSLLLVPYKGAVVSGHRSRRFVRYLGFRRRPILLGYDTVSIDRIERQAKDRIDLQHTRWSDRTFVFIGRFIREKRVPYLIDCFANYVGKASKEPRRLVLIGSGYAESEAKQRAKELNVEHLVDFLGYQPSERVSQILAGALALILPSIEETWGLVVNEALAFNLPIIISDKAGARDLLVRNLINGFVIESDSINGFAEAMLQISESQATWDRMVIQSTRVRRNGDVSRFAEAVDSLFSGDLELTNETYITM